LIESKQPARRESLDAVEAILLVAVAFLSLWTAGGWLVGALGIAGLGVAEVLVVLAPAVLLCRARRVDLRAAFPLRLPSPRTLTGALLAGAGGFYLTAAVIEAALERVAPVPPAVREQMRRMIVPAAGMRPLAIDWVVLALLPAVCEEALFRGALLGAFRSSRRGAATAVAATALLFGFYHGSAWKLLPTGALGVLLGAAAWRARSLVAPVVVHLVNNTLVILLVRAGVEDPPPPTSPTGAVLTAASLAALALGIHMIRPDASKKGGIPNTTL